GSERHALVLPTRDDDKPSAGWIDVSYWIPDHRAFFAPRHPVRYDVLAARDTTGRWRPVARDLWHLIVTHGPNVRVTIAAVDSASVIVSPYAGSVYRIDREHFEEEAWEKTFQSSDERDLCGLGVTLQCTVDEDWTSVLVGIDETSPDDANVRWRRLFEGADVLQAESHRGTYWWHLPEPIEGFPTAVRVDFADIVIGREVDFTVSEETWDAWRVSVKGQRAEFHDIRVAPNRRAQFVAHWLNLDRDALITIRQAHGSPNERGEIFCLTAEGLPINVPVDSLTLGNVNRSRLVESPRDAIVTYINFKNRDTFTFQPEEHEVPESLATQGIVTGVVSRAPRRGEGTSQYEVWWLTNDCSVAETTLNPPSNVPLGTIAVASYDAGRAVVTLKPRMIKAEGLWSAEIARFGLSVGKFDGVRYVGTTMYDDQECGVVERSPGELLILPNVPVARPLAHYEGTRFGGGFAGRERVDVHLSIRRNAPQPQRPIHRVVIRSADEIVWGHTFEDGQNLFVSDARLRLREYGSERFTVRRMFRLQRRQVVEPKRVDQDAINQAALDAYFQRPNLTLEASEATVTHSLLDKLRVRGENGQWTSRVRIAEHHGANVVSASYRGDDARLQLFVNAKQEVVGSYRNVPALDLAAFGREIGTPFNRRETLVRPLYYAGKVEEREGWHRFEWEFGRTLEIPEEQLQFDDKPFHTIQNVIFFGDALRAVTIKSEGTVATDGAVAAEEEWDEEDAEAHPLKVPQLVLVLHEVSIEFSEARILFLQRRNHQLVHLLRLQPTVADDRVSSVVISSVVGINDRSIDSSRDLDRSRAVLDPASLAMLVERFENARETQQAWERPVAYGRFDEQEFRQSLGQNVRFKVVALTFDRRKLNRLQPDELLFLRAGRGERVRNDYLLELEPEEGLHPSDVGSDAQKLRVLRRAFSVREEVLPRLIRGNPAALENQLFLVKLRLVDSRVTASLWSGMPKRRMAVLRSVLEQVSFVLATVIDADDRAISIELSPGIFITIERREIEIDAQTNVALIEGAVVRFERGKDGRTIMRPAAFSEERYLPDGPSRPAVILPKNNLFGDARLDWQAGLRSWLDVRFPIGGLPNVQAQPGSLDRTGQVWGPPSMREFRTLMSHNHPKLALAGRDKDGVARVTPAAKDVYVGKVRIQGETKRPVFVPLRDSVEWKAPLRWEYLSFADEPAATLAERLSSRTWRYHDDETCVWIGREKVEVSSLPEHDGTTGPLMFEHDSSNLHLRYHAKSLVRYGFPMRELVHALPADGSSASFTVAAVTDTSLWTEISPGRVAELPYAQIVHN
ncbi:MAG TPA: hypothetical protein VMU84_20030, partial [Thermoanaerobaculia bacterium]|nr:hypothetical protein [Thermoanaerobaculia bacterium]